MQIGSSTRYLSMVVGVVTGFLAGQLIDPRNDSAGERKASVRPDHAPALHPGKGERRTPTATTGSAFIRNGRLHLGLMEFDRMTAGLPESMAVQIAKDYGDYLGEIRELDAGGLFEAFAGNLLLSSFFGEHPEESWREIQEKCKPPKRARFATRLLNAWVIEDPDAAITAVLDLPQGSEKAELKKGLIAALTNDHPEKAAALLGSDFSHDFHSVYKSWSEQSLNAAIQGLEDIANPRILERATQAIASSYAKQDPGGALAWANSLEGGRKRSALEMVFYETAPQDPRTAAAQIEAIPSRKLRGSLVTGNMSTFWKEDPAWALGLMEKHVEAHNRPVVLGNIFTQHFETDHLEFYTKIVTDFPVGENRDKLVQRLAQGYATRDAQAAYTWLESFSEELDVDPARTRKTLEEIKARGFGATYLNWEALHPPSGP